MAGLTLRRHSSTDVATTAVQHNRTGERPVAPHGVKQMSSSSLRPSHFRELRAEVSLGA